MDCVLLVTDHSVYDYPFIMKHSPLVVDTRNAFGGEDNTGGKIVMA